MDQFLETTNRAPSVGASDLLTLLNTERLVRKTLPYRTQEKAAVALDSPSSEASVPCRGAMTALSTPGLKSVTAPKTAASGREGSRAAASALKDSRNKLGWRLRVQEEDRVQGKRRSRSSEASRTREPLILRGSSLAHSSSAVLLILSCLASTLFVAGPVSGDGCGSEEGSESCRWSSA